MNVVCFIMNTFLILLCENFAMFRKKISGTGKQNDNGVSFAYEIPSEDIDLNSDWGRANFDNAHQYSTQLRYKKFLQKNHLVLYGIIGFLTLLCAVLILVLVFATEYEIAYVDDGTTLMCRVQ